MTAERRSGLGRVLVEDDSVAHPWERERYPGRG